MKPYLLRVEAHVTSNGFQVTSRDRFESTYWYRMIALTAPKKSWEAMMKLPRKEEKSGAVEREKEEKSFKALAQPVIQGIQYMYSTDLQRDWMTRWADDPRKIIIGFLNKRLE